jgi:hypothetical protein
LVDLFLFLELPFKVFPSGDLTTNIRGNAAALYADRAWCGSRYCPQLVHLFSSGII